MSEAEPYADRYFVAKDGLKLHYRDYPGPADKPPLLCLHGLTRNARDFAHLGQCYSPDWRVLALDFRGRGLSDYDPQTARYNPLTYAADVIQLLDELTIGDAVFVGTSLGGLVTMTLAAMAPQRIAGAILNDIGPDLNIEGLERIQGYIGKGERFGSWEEAAAAIEANQAVSFPNYGRADWLAMARRNCREREGQIVFDYDARIVEPFKTSGAVPKVDLWPMFAALGRKPLLVIRGARSDLLTAATAAKMQQVAPHMTLATVPGIGHAPELSEPEAAKAIDAFLAGLQ